MLSKLKQVFPEKIRLETLKQQSSVQNECNYTLKVPYQNLNAFLVETAVILLKGSVCLDMVVELRMQYCGDIFFINY